MVSWGMPAITLPADTPLRSDGSVEMVMRAGQLVLAQPVSYPAFFLRCDDVQSRLPDYERLKSRYGNRWPAVPTAEGLVWDPDWNVFGAFFQDKYSAEGTRVLSDLQKRTVAWSLCCPVVEGPESVIGQVIRQYGRNVGAVPGKPGFNPSSEMRDYPVAKLLEKAKGLPDFRDRGLSLLDLAMNNHLWEDAEWLWQKGVRPTPTALEGAYLESLVLASHALQESSVTGFLPRDHDRVEWLERWLQRFEQTGVPVSDRPFSTWRQRVLEKNMGSSQVDGAPLVDTAPGLWIARCVYTTPGGTPKVEQASHQVGLFDAWARFWARQGVDLEQQPVRMWGDQSVVGISAFIATQDARPERAAAWEGWLNRLQVITQAERLQQDTLSPAAVRSSPRL